MGLTAEGRGKTESTTVTWYTNKNGKIQHKQINIMNEAYITQLQKPK
jgi:hypothetical protein